MLNHQDDREQSRAMSARSPFIDHVENEVNRYLGSYDAKRINNKNNKNKKTTKEVFIYI